MPPTRLARALLLSLGLAVATACDDTVERDVNAGLPPPRNEDIALARDLTARFYRGELSYLFERFSEEMQQALPADKLALMRDQNLERFGPETEVVREDWMTRGVFHGVRRVVRFEKGEDLMEVRWLFREGRIAGFEIVPAKTPTPVP
jgi:hypothetical protein